MARYTGKHTTQKRTKAGKKPLTAILAVALAAALIFGGTFAWQSISQEALNEVSGTVNPGGRLHDDFVDITEDDDLTRSYDKNVYVENFTDLADNGVQVFARVRLDEYMEFGDNAGSLNDDGTKAEDNLATSLVDGARLEDKSTWTPHIYGGEENDPFHEYWTWDYSGQTTYMPTFNKNKDSLEPDINGTFAMNFSDHDDYAEGDKSTYYAIYDADGDIEDELAVNNIDIADVIENGNLNTEVYDGIVEIKSETHTAKQTIDGYVMTMEDYIALLGDGDPGNDTGNFWVYDTDGWAYWAAPIDPNTATGLLLDGIDRTETIINEDWYYGINVVAQFITGDDLGQDDQTGFYDASEGLPPSDDALQLLNAIGVDVTFEVENVDELKTALAHGGTITLAEGFETVDITEQLVVSADTVLDLGTNTINGSGIWEDTDVVDTWSLISVQGEGTTLTINGGNFVAAENDSFCVDVRDGGRVVINDGTFKGNISAVYVHTGEAVINGGEFSIQQVAFGKENPYDELLNCYDENYANGTASITVTGGTFNDFNPGASNDGNLLYHGYNVSSRLEGNTTIYTVSAPSDTITVSEDTE